MEQITIEGTWEEVARRAGELAGHRVRVIVLDAVAPPESSRGRQAEAGAASPATNPVMGMFSDAPDLLDEVVEEAMKIREERPWRLPAGE